MVLANKNPFLTRFDCPFAPPPPTTGSHCHHEDERYAEFDKHFLNQLEHCRSPGAARLHPYRPRGSQLETGDVGVGPGNV